MLSRPIAVGVGVALVAAVLAPLPAEAATPPSHPPIIASVGASEPGVTAGGPVQIFGDGSKVDLNENSSINHLFLTFEGASDSSGITIFPPTGEKLRAGRWTGIRSFVNDPTKPSVSVDGHDFDGDLDILDIAANSAGVLTRFDILFRTSDTESAQSAWGEVRMGEPADTSSVRIGTTHVVFPLTPKGSRPIFTIESLHNTSAAPVRIGRAALADRSATSYALSDDHCSGTTLASGQTCTLRVGFSPRGGGPLVATLRLPVGSGTRLVQLSGDGELGTTSVVFTGDDFISTGTTHGATTATNTFASGKYQLAVNGPVNPVPGGDTGWWYVSSLVPYGPQDPPAFQLSASGDLATGVGNFSLLANHHGCGAGYDSSVKATKFATDAIGRPTLIDADFTQSCVEAPQYSMHGTLRYQDRADVTPPARVTGLRISGGATRSASWTASSDATRTTIARLIKGDGTNATATSGYALVSGSVTSARLPALTPKAHYVVAVFTVDTTGNTSAPVLAPIVG